MQYLTLPAQPVFVARQPILSASQRIAGYELLFRHDRGATCAEVEVPLQATAEVLNHSLLTIGLDALTGGKPSFVNFPREAILRDLARHLPPELVIEVLEDVGGDPEVVAACAALRRRGFRIALDDYCFEEAREPLLAVADVVKVDLTLVSLDTPGLWSRLDRLRRRGVQLLAEKVETPEQFTRARALGFDLFQGYLWGHPEIMGGRQLAPAAASYQRLVRQLGRPDFDLDAAKEIVKSDPGLAQALLRYVRSTRYRWAPSAESVHHALALLGRDEMRRWAGMLGLLTAFDGIAPELVTAALRRGRALELLAPAVGEQARASDLFFAGMFSLADAMFGTTMVEALGSVPMDEVSRTAILEPASRLGRLLAALEACEQEDCGAAADAATAAGVAPVAVATAYMEAVLWSGRVLGADERRATTS